MKKRMPNTIEDAVTIVIGSIGAEAAGEVIGKSASLIRKMADPDVSFCPSLEQAMMLDAACHAGGGGMPLFALYKRAMQHAAAGGEAPTSAERLDRAMLSLTASVGEVAGALRAATAEDSDAGAALSVNERADIAAQTRQLRGELDKMEAALGARPHLAKG